MRGLFSIVSAARNEGMRAQFPLKMGVADWGLNLPSDSLSLIALGSRRKIGIGKKGKDQ